MASGLLALLDDITLLTRAAAANLDDIAAQVTKTGSKVSGIIIDDAAVTPKYVVGLDPKRELSIIYNIGKKSLFNKIVFLTPAALILGYFLPWIIQPILMLGGCFLCFEGFEKIHSLFAPKHKKAAKDIPQISPDELEKIRTNSAVRTDFILSAEIIAITYSDLVGQSLMMQIAALLAIGTIITIVVYGTVGIIVKMDDIGLYFMDKRYSKVVRKIGKSIVVFMPYFLSALGAIGTAAMLWVGFDIIAHNIPVLYDNLKKISSLLPFASAAQIAFSSMGGIVLGCGVYCVVKLAQFIFNTFKSKTVS